jgi:hypothetical protein
MRVETVREDGNGAVVAGLVGTKSEKFRSVRLTPTETEALTILDTAASFDGDGELTLDAKRPRSISAPDCRLRLDHRGVDLISDAPPFGRGVMASQTQSVTQSVMRNSTAAHMMP